MFSQRRGAIFWPKRGLSCQKREFEGSRRPKREFGGSRRPSGGLLFKKILNVKLLLFTDPIVVLLLLLTIRTVFSA